MQRISPNIVRRLLTGALDRTAKGSSAIPLADDPAVQRSGEDISSNFSLLRLHKENKGLADQYLWGTNSAPAAPYTRPLHLGCGARILDGFVNIDITPQSLDVLQWDLLDLWPDALNDSAEGAFSEDCIEHFYQNEQTYIICNINRALARGATARILMPSVGRLVESYLANGGALFFTQFGIETSADNLNHGMRFTGHRWLHDNFSLGRMSGLCGFEALATDCATSTVAKYNGLNLRDETNSASFAMDLRKVRDVSRLILEPLKITGATKVEDLGNGVGLYRSTDPCPLATYTVPERLQCNDISCVNFRSSNLSSFDWNIKALFIDERPEPWRFDDTLKSKACMNIVTQSQLLTVMSQETEISIFNFSPANRSGDYFTLGCLEIFSVQ